MSEAVRPGRMARLRNRLFHLYFLLRRPMTLGVRAVVYDKDRDAILLVRHTYVPGWHLPGGGVDPGETISQALARELQEEANLELTHEPLLRSVHLNLNASRRDHVALFVVNAFRQTEAKRPDREIAEADFFPVSNLPPDTSLATRRRVEEVFTDAAAAPLW